MTYSFQPPRFTREVVPFGAVIEDWMKKCEKELLVPGVARDYARVRDHVFADKFPAASGEKPLYIATAGGPCSGKSTELDFELASGRDKRYAQAVLIDPDRYTMPYMFVYQDLLSAGTKANLGAAEAAKVAYDRARPGSNIIASLNLNEATSKMYSVAHGTTGTAPTFGPVTLKKLGDMGYERKLLLVAAPDDVRTQAGQKRIEKEAHYQVDPTDFVEKGKAFPQRHADYFTHGDHVVLLWKPELEKPAVRAAEYKDGQRHTLDQAAFDSYVAKYSNDSAALLDKGIILPAWAQLEQTYCDRFNPTRNPVPPVNTTPKAKP